LQAGNFLHRLVPGLLGQGQGFDSLAVTLQLVLVVFAQFRLYGADLLPEEVLLLVFADLLAHALLDLLLGADDLHLAQEPQLQLFHAGKEVGLLEGGLTLGDLLQRVEGNVVRQAHGVGLRHGGQQHIRRDTPRQTRKFLKGGGQAPGMGLHLGFGTLGKRFLP